MLWLRRLRIGLRQRVSWAAEHLLDLQHWLLTGLTQDSGVEHFFPITMADAPVQHHGGCHCRRVRYKVTAPGSIVVWDCNCSDCAMRGNVHFIVPKSDFELEESSKEYLTLYTFNTHTAKHYFCKVCGITSFYIPRSNPDGVAVTVKCLDPGTVSHVEVKSYDGRNWEANYEKSGIAALSKPSLTTS